MPHSGLPLCLCRAHIVAQEGAIINLTADEGLLEDSNLAALGLLGALPRERPPPNGQPAAVPWTAELAPANEAFTVPAQVGQGPWQAMHATLACLGLPRTVPP